MYHAFGLAFEAKLLERFRLAKEDLSWIELGHASF